MEDMPQRWTLGGLALKELLRRTCVEAWQDAVYGKAGRMAFYHFLAVFPCLLIFLLLARGIRSIGLYLLGLRTTWRLGLTLFGFYNRSRRFWCCDARVASFGH